MNLVRCRILGFGKLSGLTLDFHEGLNLIFAANEGGKSTLQRFLVSMLYGQLRADLKSQRRLEAWVEQYKPWRGDAYGGVLFCRMANGRELEIHRSFGRDETLFEIRGSTGELVMDEYEQQKNGDVLFARRHLDLSKELFESIAVIRESRLTELNSQDSIRDRITNLAQSGAEDLSIRQSLDRLRAAMDEIGSERAPTKPYMIASEQLSALRVEGTALTERRAEFQTWVDERNRLAEEVSRLEREHAAAKKTALTARLRDAESRVRALENLDRELASLRIELEPLRACTSFPAQHLEELHQLVGARGSLERNLADVRSRLAAVQEQAHRAELERQQVEAYGSINSEKISNWFLHYLSLTVKRDEAFKSLAQSREEAQALEGSLGRLGPALRNPDIDWQRKAREAAEEERAATERVGRLGEKVTAVNSQLSSARRRRSQRVLWGYLAVLLALAPLAARYLWEPEALPLLPALGLGALFGALAVASFLSAARTRPVLERSTREIKSLQEEQARVRDEGQKTRRELQQLYQDLGYDSLENFLEDAKRAEQYRQRFADLSDRAAEQDGQREKLHAECSEVFTNITEALGRVGLSCSPGNIKNQIDVMRSNVRRFRDLDLAWRRLVEQTAALQAEEASLSSDLSAKTTREQAILLEAGVESPEEFREGCSRRQRALELSEKEASRAREFQRLRGDLTLEAWRRRTQELDEASRSETGAPSSSAPATAVTSSVAANTQSLFLPYVPGVEEAEKEEKQIADRLAAAREEYARVKERVTQAFQGYRSAPEIEEDLAAAERRVRELSFNREALRIASECILALSREQQEILAPQLNGSVEQRFLRLCQGRYEEVRIDPEFRIYVRESGTGQLRALEHLSRGTQDQLYFALRFGIVDLVSSCEEPCPCLMDEPFAAYDHQRITEAFRILEEEARHRQLFVFTCREDLRDFARAQAAHILEL